MSTAEATVLVAATLGVAGVAHSVGRSVSWRARLLRVLRHRAVAWAGAGSAVVGGGVLALLRRAQDPPRQYADYLPDDGADAATTSLSAAVPAVLLIGAGAVLAAVWLRLRYGSLPGPRGSLTRLAVPVAGGLLLLAGMVGDWIAVRTTPPSYGWYLYSPLTSAPVAEGLGTDPGITRGMSTALGVLGLGVLTAVAAFRAGRRQTATDGEG